MAGWQSTLRALARQPGVHFVLVGGALFLLRAGLAPSPPPVAPRPAADRPAVRPVLSDDELLYREALRLGLDRAQAVERRLILNMRFLQLDAKASDRQLYEQARAIGFQRTDPVVRRWMVQQMRLLARAGSKPDVFTRAELAGYLRNHQERFTIPTFVRLTHVFLSADRRGAAAREDARRLLAKLRAGQVSPDAAPALGDPFLLGHHTGMVGASDLERVYGAGFARAVMRLPVAVWSGPVESSQGVHLVWIHEARAPEPAKLADVRSQVVLALAAERGDVRLADYLRRLRDREAAKEEAR